MCYHINSKCLCLCLNNVLTFYSLLHSFTPIATYLFLVFHREISSKFNISISTAQQYVSYVANKFFEHMDSVILWPSHQQANLEVQGFDEMPGNKFPGVLGVIGTVELNNSTTANPNPSERTNYKSSIVIQVRHHNTASCPILLMLVYTI